jgi:hypothetical protein
MTFNLGEFCGCASFFFVVFHVISFGPGAIEGNFRLRADIPCAGAIHFSTRVRVGSSPVNRATLHNELHLLQDADVL